VDKKVRGRQALGESLPPGDSDWGNLTITSQQRIADRSSLRLALSLLKPICGIIAKSVIDKDDHA
jgi:hypothetical protein